MLDFKYLIAIAPSRGGSDDILVEWKWYEYNYDKEIHDSAYSAHGFGAIAERSACAMAATRYVLHPMLRIMFRWPESLESFHAGKHVHLIASFLAHILPFEARIHEGVTEPSYECV